MKTDDVVLPDFLAIVDLDYAGSFEHWIGTLRRLSDLPEDPTLCVQVRVKSRSDDELVVLAAQAREAFRNATVTLSWNGDPHIASSCGFDACHQPQACISAFPEETSHLTHSASIHDLASLRLAQSFKADFVVFGPVFQPRWKNVSAQGIDELTRLTSISSIPVVALGGIHLGNVSKIPQTGVYGIACLSSVMDSDDPVVAVTELQSEWKAHSGSHHDTLRS